MSPANTRGPVETRRVRPEEYGTVGAITVAAYAGFTEGPDDPYLELLRDAARRDREAEVWVALVEGDLVGSVTVCPPGSPWREVARDGEGEFRMLAVDPRAQGLGVGRALTRLVLDRFTADRQRAVVLSSLPQMTTAHALYASLGFQRRPERDHHILWAFARDLEPGA